MTADWLLDSTPGLPGGYLALRLDILAVRWFGALPRSPVALLLRWVVARRAASFDGRQRGIAADGLTRGAFPISV